MRVIGGVLAGRRFNIDPKLKLRPTTDMAKEALFNMLSARFDLGGRVLDLFSGTGAIGIEFASRGASKVLCVEKVARHAASLRKLISVAGLEDIMEVRVADALRFITYSPDESITPFDFIFADPPYNLNELVTIPEKVFASPLLSDRGIFILEHPKEYDFGTHPYFRIHRSYSAVNFSLFSRSNCF